MQNWRIFIGIMSMSEGVREFGGEEVEDELDRVRGEAVSERDESQKKKVKQ